MTPTSVYAVSPRWDPAFVWPLVRATSTQPAPTSKPVGSPPCATPRLVGPLIPPLSRKWRSGSKPWLLPTSPQPHLYQTTAPLHPHPPLTQPDPHPVTSHPHPLYQPPLTHITYSPHRIIPTPTPPLSPLAPSRRFRLRPHHPPILLYKALPRRTLTSTGQANL
jgi:hypothetical protein